MLGVSLSFSLFLSQANAAAMSWMVPEHKYDPDQKRFLDSASGGENYWVSGFAGSGKSVLILATLIRAKHDNPNLKACIVLYTRSLIDLIRAGIPDEIGDVSVKTYYQFRRDNRKYDLILVDEVQDLPEKDLRQICSQCDQLIVAGDDDQSIYDDRVDSDSIPEITRSERFSLTRLHRLPPNVVELAKEIFPDKNLEVGKQTRMASVQPRIGEAETDSEEIEYVWEKARQFGQPGSPAAILIPSHSEIVSFANSVLRHEGQPTWKVELNRYKKNDYASMNQHLQQTGIKLRYLGSRYGSLREAESEGRVFLMTYHSVKGLDFEAVFIPGLSEHLTIWKGDSERARTLFYVALTRSRRDLYLTYTGRPHRFLQRFPEGAVHKVSIPEPVDEENDDPFGDISF